MSTVENIKTNKQFITTHHSDVLCTNRQDVVGLVPCTHEEADARIILYLEDVVREKHNKISIPTVDTDVVVLAITATQRLDTLNYGLPLVLVRVSSTLLFMKWPEHWDLVNMLPYQCFMPLQDVTQCQALEAEATGLHGTPGKPMNMSPSICALAVCPSSETIEKWLQPLERIVVLLYDRTRCQEYVNEARKELFTQKGREIDALPPTQAALVQHTKRAAYQAGHCWSQAMIGNPEIPCLSDWGWSKKAEGGWEVCWTMLPEASQVWRELIHCGYKKLQRTMQLPNSCPAVCSVLLFAFVVDFVPE